MVKKIIQFGRTAKDMELMAALVAQFVREGITFECHNDAVGFEVWITGGY